MFPYQTKYLTEKYDNGGGDTSQEIAAELEQKLSSLPKAPGVYQFKNESGKIIYVGKAINLRNRVRSYFKGGRHPDAKTTALVRKIADLETIVTDSEAEALILEDTLIKKFKPRYNILLRDDKSYPYLRITNEPFPRVFVTRKIIRDGSKYYGPFTEVRYFKNLLRIIRSLFPLRSCDFSLTKENIQKGKFKVCLDYHIGKCEAPCIGLVDEAHYSENLKRLVQVINGKTDPLEKLMEKEMENLSAELNFEQAKLVRDKYLILKDYTSQQKIVTADLADRDIIGVSRIDDDACSLVFTVRDGKLTGKRHYIITDAGGLTDSEIIQSTIEKWYLENEFIPKEIFLPAEPGQPEFILDWLKKKRGKSLEILVPKLGDKKKLVTLAATNAEYMLRDYHLSIAKREQTTAKAVLALQKDLNLSKPPVRIECFDNSHIQGSELVSSVVVFVDGKPKKQEYRRFRIKTVSGNDDFAAMQEVVRRRYTRVLGENSPLPDLIIIDGGKGQLSHAFDVLKELKIETQVPVISLAKRIDEVFFPDKQESLYLPRTSAGLRLIQQLRNEAHRFAITYHRKLREKRTLKTELTEIPGIGEKLSKKLLIEFGSVENIRTASPDSLEKTIGKRAAAKVAEYFKEK